LDQLKSLLQLAGGHPLQAEDDGPARRTQLVILAAFASSLLAAAYGIAVAGDSLAFGLRNLYSMPMVIMLSSIGAVPAGLLAWKLMGSPTRASDLVLGMASGTFSGCLVLAVMSPLVALYQYTSDWMGAILALGTAALGLTVGMLVVIRSAWVRAPAGMGFSRSMVPVAVMLGVHMLTIVQLIATSSLMPEKTFLDNGIEALSSAN
jgi:hypothetical protein